MMSLCFAKERMMSWHLRDLKVLSVLDGNQGVCTYISREITMKISTAMNTRYFPMRGLNKV